MGPGSLRIHGAGHGALTVERGLYIAPDADVPEAYRGIGVQVKMTLSLPETGVKT